MNLLTKIYQKKWMGEDWLKAALLLVTFLSYFFLARYLPMSEAPDEAMRMALPDWILRHHTLPVGNEADLIDPSYGFSYAYLPYLPSLIAVGMMHAVSLVRSSPHAMLFAARLVSVFAGTGCVFLCLKIGPYCFKNKWSTLFLATFVGFLPQVTFLSAYLNNDAFSLFTDFLILYCLLRGRRMHWAWKQCAFLSVAIALNMLTYYNAYGWILVSILFCILSVMQDRTIPQKGIFILQRSLFIAGIVLCLAGWFFVRNALLHGGDFLGREAMRQCARDYAAAGHTVHDNTSASEMGLSLWGMVSDETWTKTTIESFIGTFGNMSLYLGSWVYRIYELVIAAGLVLFFVAACQKKVRNAAFNFLLLLGIVIPIGLALNYSYLEDYQPQGRYMMPLLPGLAILVAAGYDVASEFLKKLWKLKIQTQIRWKEKSKAEYTWELHIDLAAILLVVWLCLYGVVFGGTIRPNYYPHNMIYARLSDNQQKIDVTYTPAAQYDGIQIAVWSDGGSPNWESAQLDEQGIWHASFDVSDYSEKDAFYIHVYRVSNGKMHFVIGEKLKLSNTVGLESN